MKTWDDWSDAAVSIAIMELIYGKPGGDKDILQLYHTGRFDYCNNWSDMGPLLINEDISIIDDNAYHGFWFGFGEVGWDYKHQDKNQLRAAAIVFLMMNGVKP